MAKKVCDICGKEVGFLSQEKLKDGLVCSDCLSKVAGRKASQYSKSYTLEQIEDAIEEEITLPEPITCQCTDGVLVIEPFNRILYKAQILCQKTDDIPLDSIIGYSYNEDEKQYGVGHALGGAAVGGMVFGGAGAIVGSVLGSNPRRKIRNIQIDITYELNGECQLFVARLYRGKPIKTSGFEYKNYIENAKKVMGQLDLLLKELFPDDKDSSGNSNSDADEIRKFKELLDDGIITKEEFDAKKKDILNL